MQADNATWLRTALEGLPTRQLEEMLQEELTREQPNSSNIRLALKILQEREKDDPVEAGPEAEAAWEKYLDDIDEPIYEHSPKGRWALRIASVAAIVILLLAALPQEASARNFFERLISWTDSVFALIGPEDACNITGEYVFRTDNPGLQQVYDTVVGFGVTQPVVPMWLPEGYELVECKVIDTPTKNAVVALFSNGSSEVHFEVSIYADNIASKYYKDEDDVVHVELAGVSHNVTKNVKKWVAVWVRDNYECSIFADCQEDVFMKILRSIYVLEEE